MNKICAVYKITNTITGDFYIGSSKNIKQRWACHKCQSSWKNQPNNPMYLDMQKYGLDNFSFQILEEVKIDRLKETEQQFIEKLKPTYNSNNANGWDFDKYKEHQIEYYQQNRDRYKEHYQQNRDKYKEYKKEYYQQNRKKYQEYDNKSCSYNGEVLTLCALATRFRRAGIEHPTKEAKKYIIKNNNPIEFYDIYP